MKKITSLLLVLLFVFSCASQKTIEEDDFATDSSGDEIAASDDLELSDSDLTADAGSGSSDVATNSGATEEFEEFESVPSTSTAQNSDESALEQELNQVDAAENNTIANNETALPADGELSLDESVDVAQNDPQKMTGEDGFSDNVLEQNQAVAGDELSLEDSVADLNAAPAPELAPETAFPDDVIMEAPPAVAMDTPTEVVPEPESVAVVDITALNYKANDNGGTLVVEATGPLVYDVRKNENLNQFIIEIKNSRLPQRLARPLNTKDMVGTIGSIDAYQNNDSNMTRVVIQLREGAQEPLVQVEGNRLLVVGDGPAVGSSVAANGSAGGSSVDLATGATLAADGTMITEEIPLPAQTFEEFLTLTPKFVGKKISLEMDAPVSDVIKFISTESGANLIIDDQVNALGGNISFKLKDVPWDQALVTVLKLKNLVYIRQGTVLRITTQDRLEAAQKIIDDLKQKKVKEEKLVVKHFPLSFVKPSDIKTNIENFKSKEGKVLTDDKTSSLIITDTKDVVDQLEKVIRVLDIAPSQVLIEGKVVEASEGFTRNLGVKWGAPGVPVATSLKGAQDATVNLQPRMSVDGQGDSFTSPNEIGFTLGTLDFFGDISASLQLGESENKVKVVSSPRVVTTNNEVAQITQNNSIPITSSTPGPGGVPVAKVDYIDVPLTLSVTPAVTNNGFVKMKINVQRSFLANSSSTPGINRRSADTNVLVKDGQTAVIGGIFSEDDTKSNSGVPVLKDIPVLGGLFRGQGTIKNKNELLIFVTPKILNFDENANNSDFLIQ